MSHSPYPITSSYGPRASGFHGGVDLGMPTGTTLCAPRKGKAYVQNEGNKSYGLWIKIVAGDVSIYMAHLSKALVSTGQTVTPGQVIAKSGNSGSSSGPHLHFEVRVNGKTVKPYTYYGSLFHQGSVVTVGPSLIEWAFQLVYEKSREDAPAFYDKMRATLKKYLQEYVNTYGKSPVESPAFFKKFLSGRGIP